MRLWALSLRVGFDSIDPGRCSDFKVVAHQWPSSASILRSRQQGLDTCNQCRHKRARADLSTVPVQSVMGMGDPVGLPSSFPAVDTYSKTFTAANPETLIGRPGASKGLCCVVLRAVVSPMYRPGNTVVSKRTGPLQSAKSHRCIFADASAWAPPGWGQIPLMCACVTSGCRPPVPSCHPLHMSLLGPFSLI